MRYIIGLTLFAVLVMCGVAWQGSRSLSPSDVTFLASDFYFAIGGQHIVLPAVALRRQPAQSFSLAPDRREGPNKSLRHARNPAAPLQMDSVSVSIRAYDSYSKHFGPPDICELLTRAWSRMQCHGQPGGLLGRLPEKFDLMDRSKLDRLKSYGTVGRETRYDQIKDMSFRPGIPEIGCDRQSPYCTAAVEALPGLLAVWTVRTDPDNGPTAAQWAKSQGTAIVQFVQRAIGPTEDTTLADAQ